MFENIGGKIKTLAVIICWIGIIASVVAACALWMENSRRNPTGGLGFVILIAGCLSSWIGSFVLYAIGEITESTEKQTKTLVQLYETQKKMNVYLENLQEAAKEKSSVKEVKSVSEFLPEL